jgi:hypothetical protein
MHKLGWLSTLSLMVAACGTTESDGTELAATCDSEQLAMSGAFEASTPSAATVHLSGSILGVGGFTADATASYVFVVRDYLQDNLQAVGTHDVAAEPVKYVEAAASADCTKPGQCSGFVALTGTVEVLAVAPFHATFTLSDLHVTDGSSDVPGEPIAGSVTGCLFAPQ